MIGPLCNIGMHLIQPKLHNINPHNINHSLISQNPREWMLVAQISLLIVTFLSLISRNLLLMQATKEVNPHPRIAPCLNTWSCHLILILLFLLLLMSLVKFGCMCMPHRPRRPSRVDHTNGGKRRMFSSFVVSHATLILQ